MIPNVCFKRRGHLHILLLLASSLLVADFCFCYLSFSLFQRWRFGCPTLPNPLETAGAMVEKKYWTVDRDYNQGSSNDLFLFWVDEHTGELVRFANNKTSHPYPEIVRVEPSSSNQNKAVVSCLWSQNLNPCLK